MQQCVTINTTNFRNLSRLFYFIVFIVVMRDIYHICELLLLLLRSTIDHCHCRFYVIVVIQQAKLVIIFVPEPATP